MASATPTNTVTPIVGDSIQGCTPGYWKQKQHFDSWLLTPYNPDDTVGSVFANAHLVGLEGNALLQALSYPGNKEGDKAHILLRAAVAALLNSVHPDVSYAPAWTASEIIVNIDEALASGDPDWMLNLKDILDSHNSAGCPLN